MNKKAQVTIFVILGIVIIGGVLAYFIFKGNLEQEKELPAGFEEIKTFTQNCIETSSNEAIYLSGEGGGYVYKTNFSDSSNFTYSSYEGQTVFPSLSKLESKLSIAITGKILTCLNNFESFKDVKVSQGVINANVQILDDSVNVKVNYPLTLTKGNVTETLSEFEEVVIPVRLGKMHAMISRLIQENYYSEEGICISCIVDEAYVEGFLVNYFEINESKVFIIEDLKEKNTEKKFRYIIANKLYLNLIK